MSRTTTETLIYMANQIARNFGTMSDTDAAAATADHIWHFWDPRMIAGIKAADQSLLSPAARAAIPLIHAQLPPQTRATEFASADGTSHSDAG